MYKVSATSNQRPEPDPSLFACDQSTGRECFVRTGPRAELEAEAAKQNALGRDYFVTSPRAPAHAIQTAPSPAAGLDHVKPGERSAKDYAIERGGYLSTRAELLLEALNNQFTVAQNDTDLEDDLQNAADEEANDKVAECFRALKSEIYEFGKRRDRALASNDVPAPPAAGPLRADWRSFIEQCAKSAGGMVNGNRLSLEAKALLLAEESREAPQSAKPSTYKRTMSDGTVEYFDAAPDGGLPVFPGCATGYTLEPQYPQSALLERAPPDMNKVVVVINGGALRGVIAALPIEIALVDFDTMGCDEGDLTPMLSPDDGEQNALITLPAVVVDPERCASVFALAGGPPPAPIDQNTSAP